MIKQEWKQDCTHIDHNQVDPSFHLKSLITSVMLDLISMDE